FGCREINLDGQYETVCGSYCRGRPADRYVSGDAESGSWDYAATIAAGDLLRGRTEEGDRARRADIGMAFLGRREASGGVFWPGTAHGDACPLRCPDRGHNRKGDRAFRRESVAAMGEGLGADSGRVCSTE